MDQTPAHDNYNPDLLRLMDRGFATVVEVGCSRGALARAYRESFPDAGYVGVEIDPGYAEAARRHCDRVLCGDIENLPQADWASLFPSDCWVFGDALEHLRDPWRTLRALRRELGAGAQVLACIPNAQHWSVQARLSAGAFNYEDQGLLDRTHLRWFTRSTIVELFHSSGFRIEKMLSRVFEEPARERFLPAIAALAEAAGADRDKAVRDCQPLQYVLRAVPA
ncbi:MAG: class I SAM-dependent methyltransferase [Burkholderiales bacterium]|nr:class I SAM-dependent methyltransferase [Burkholderiales bacterium]